MRAARGTHSRVGAVAALALAGMLWAPSEALAAPSDNWGAIAISVDTGKVGWAFDHPTAGGAGRAATARCGAEDCTTTVATLNGCAAVAQAADRSWGAGRGVSRREAEARARADTPGSGPRIVAVTCTSGHRR